MVGFYLIAYYKVGFDGHYSVLEDGKKTIKHECTGTNYPDLADRIRQERDFISLDIPVGFINMVPSDNENTEAARFSPIHEKTIMQRLFMD